MNYHVLWKLEAEETLLQLWTTASDSSEISTAVNQINDALADDPISVGESREGDDRVMFVLPLAVEFFVDVTQRTVTVTRIWLSGRRQS